jgi:putative transport protein
VVGPASGIDDAARALGDSERGLSEVDALGSRSCRRRAPAGIVDVPLPAAARSSSGRVAGLWSSGCASARSRAPARSRGRSQGRQPGVAPARHPRLSRLRGTRSGATFADAIGTGAGLELLAAGAFIAAVFAALIPLVVQLTMRTDVVQTAGHVRRIETQPAALAYASDRTAGDERVNAAYALVFPVAMIARSSRCSSWCERAADRALSPHPNVGPVALLPSAENVRHHPFIH